MIGDSFNRCRYPWAGQDAQDARQAYEWATSATPCDNDMTGSQERFIEKVFTDVKGGSTRRDQYWRWVFQEVDMWFDGFGDDTPQARASYAASVAKACPPPPEGES